jgi:Tfp pilus assembly protein PilN
MGGIVNLWHFWCKEYSKIIPSWLSLPGFRFSNTIDINLYSIDTFFANPSDVLKASIKRKSITNARIRILLTEPDVLKRHVNLPPASKKHSTSALSLNLQKRSILPLAKLAWINVFQQKKYGKLHYSQFISKRDTLFEIHQVCHSLKVDCLSIGVVGTDQDLTKFPDPIHYATRIWRYINISLLVVAFGWWVNGHMSEQAHLRDVNTALETKISDLRENAMTLTAQQNETAQKKTNLTAVFDTFQNGRGTVDVLYALTQNLPEDTWVSEFHFSGNQLSFSGFTQQDVPELLTTLKSLDLVQDAVLTSAISGNKNTKSKRFSMRLSLASKVVP